MSTRTRMSSKVKAASYRPDLGVGHRRPGRAHRVVVVEVVLQHQDSARKAGPGRDSHLPAGVEQGLAGRVGGVARVVRVALEIEAFMALEPGRDPGLGELPDGWTGGGSRFVPQR